ncbi:hypothetical protein [Bacteriovorax sp. Seq25_V]|uniref:hypothetical protein n=1 Tax=Bacteriovorax sp. Seq25_V TaxID=1201288 RepID=UPI00038A04CC|nr:hypothetical protein [Bacteriovorax sp. Seq25_V]EQC46935.1 hypothetical protein M900_2603 [Bacteriovorax sp. Seq25_V]
MDKKKYYIILFVLFLIESLLDYFFDIPLEYHLSYLVPLVFSLYLTHPNIEEYKKSPRRFYSFSRALFGFHNFLSKKFEGHKYRDVIVTFVPSFTFFCVLLLLQMNFLLILAYLLGVVVFIGFERLYNKIR